MMILFSLNGCAFLLVGAGVGVASRMSNAHYKEVELETKEEYGKYRLEMQQKNIEPILAYEEWLQEQVKDPEKAERWSKVLKKVERNQK